jgi:RHS repeat-associated protein
LQKFAVDFEGTLRYFAWDGMNQIVEKDSALVTQKRHTHGATPIEGIGSIVVTRKGGSEWQVPSYDHRGSLFYLADSEDGVTDLVNEFNAYGEPVVVPSGDAPTRFGYQGTFWMQFSVAGQTRYVSMRPYRPVEGRFGQRDPLGRGSNLYLYVRNAPPMLVDPWGLDARDTWRRVEQNQREQRQLRQQIKQELGRAGTSGADYDRWQELMEKQRKLQDEWDRLIGQYPSEENLPSPPRPKQQYGPDNPCRALGNRKPTLFIECARGAGLFARAGGTPAPFDVYINREYMSEWFVGVSATGIVAGEELPIRPIAGHMQHEWRRPSGEGRYRVPQKWQGDFRKLKYSIWINCAEQVTEPALRWAVTEPGTIGFWGADTPAQGASDKHTVALPVARRGTIQCWYEIRGTLETVSSSGRPMRVHPKYECKNNMSEVGVVTIQ